MNYQLIEFMAADKLPKEYQQFPFNFLYAFFKLCLEELRLEKKEFVSHKKDSYEMYEFNGTDESTVIIFEKQGEKVTLKFYLKKFRDPNFENNYGFDDQFTGQNLSIITSDSKNALKLRLSEKVEIELGLDPFKADTEELYPFGETIKFNAWFWKEYQKVIKEEFLAVADN